MDITLIRSSLAVESRYANDSRVSPPKQAPKTLIASALTDAISNPNLKPHTAALLSSLPQIAEEHFSPYEAHALVEILSDPEFQEHSKKWLPTDPDLPQKLQTCLNERINSSDLLKVAFHDLMEVCKTSTKGELLEKLCGYLINLFISPFKVLYSLFKVICVKEDRDHFVQKIKDICTKKSISYQDRKKLIYLLMQVGISGVIGLAVGSLILSGGLSALPFIAFGSVAAAGIAAKIADNHLLHNKSPVLTAGELFREIGQISVETLPVSLATGGLLKITGNCPLIKSSLNVYNNSSPEVDTVGAIATTS